MRIFPTLILCAAILLFFSETNAQKVILPFPLNKDSSISELLKWLDETSFVKAQIRIDYAEGFWLRPIPAESPLVALYSPGFKRVETAKKCEMVLQSERSPILDGDVNFPRHLPDNDPFIDSEYIREQYRKDSQILEKIIANGTTYTSAIGINLKRLKPEIQLSPNQLKDKTENIKNLKPWRIRFKQKSLLLAIDSAIYLPDKIGTSDIYDSLKMSGNEVEFSFDDEKSAVEFGQVFRRAIKLCRGSK